MYAGSFASQPPCFLTIEDGSEMWGKGAGKSLSFFTAKLLVLPVAVDVSDHLRVASRRKEIWSLVSRECSQSKRASLERIVLKLAATVTLSYVARLRPQVFEINPGPFTTARLYSPRVASAR